MAPRTALALLFVPASVLGLVAVVDGCGSDTPGDTGGGSTTDAPSNKPDGTTITEPDATTTTDAAKDAPGVDASDSGANGKGETCVGFAKGTPCGANGLPDYGYVCFNGSPPGIAGCVLATSSGSFGSTYCCTENKCVAQPDQDKECKTPQPPHRYQCPPNGTGGTVTPAAGCADGGNGGMLQQFACCP